MPSEHERFVMQRNDPSSVLKKSSAGYFSVTRYATATLSNADFIRLSGLIRDFCGIRLPPTKKMMLEGRLRKRLQALGMESFAEYCAFLFDSGKAGDEYVHMLDTVTTNKTDFFREPEHFQYLLDKVLPELVISKHIGIGRSLNAWSAGCSTGEEPYTLAMVLSEFAEKVPRFHFSVLGTDISTKVLAKAVSGIYAHQSVEPISMLFRKKYLLKSRCENGVLVRIIPELRATVQFSRLNFMDEDYGLGQQMSIVFCRNVLIYFDKPVQEMVLGRITNQLIPGGYLFTGHSEIVHDMDLPLVQTAATVYRKI